jgi:hypothetical protein
MFTVYVGVTVGWLEDKSTPVEVMGSEAGGIEDSSAGGSCKELKLSFAEESSILPPLLYMSVSLPCYGCTWP